MTDINHCYGCNTGCNLIFIWDNNGRSFPVCVKCYETNPLYMNAEKLNTKIKNGQSSTSKIVPTLTMEELINTKLQEIKKDDNNE